MLSLFLLRKCVDNERQLAYNISRQYQSIASKKREEDMRMVKVDDLKPCPKCKGEIELYSSCNYTNGSNCFARCKLCKAEFTIPTELKANGVKIYPASIKKAHRIWNENNKQLKTR